MAIPHWLWGAWTVGIVALAVWFAVMEGIALANRAGGDTLTEVVRSLDVPPVVWFASAGLISGLLVWAVPHLIGEWRI